MQGVGTRGNIALKLKALRTARGETLQTVAAAVGVSKPHIWNLEKGNQRVSLALLGRLASHFGVPLQEFLGENSYPTPKQAQGFAREFAGRLTLAQWAVVRQVAMALAERQPNSDLGEGAGKGSAIGGEHDSGG